jgi:hypothetical protein
MPKMTKEEYLKTYLKDMDEVQRQWYISKIEKWTKEDYDNYIQNYLEMMGEPTEDDLSEIQKINNKWKT